MHSDKYALAPTIWFILLTFAVTYAVEFALIQDMRFDNLAAQSTPALWLLAVMWIPGGIALLVSLFIEKTPLKDLRKQLALRVGSLGPYIITLILAPAVFMFAYGLSWMFGMTSLDTTMSTLTSALGSETPVTQKTVFQTLLPLSIFLGPIINFIFALGEELGWRGYLLPRLLQYGRIPAHLILGIIWGLWHAPLIYAGFNYPGHPVTGIIMMCILSTAFGIFINEMTLHYRSTFLAAFIHAAVNAQGYGIWAWIFPDTDPIQGGGTGFLAIAVWLVTGAITVLILSKLTPDTGKHHQYEELLKEQS